MALHDLRKSLREQVRARTESPLIKPVFPPQSPTLAYTPPPELLELAERTHPRLHQSLLRLNPQQLRAVLSDDPAALVRAQVGSGKTAVLVHKVLWLHLVQQVPMKQLAVLTFTHKAAGEIRTRIEALAGDTGTPLTAADFWLTGTFHSVARNLLQNALPIEDLGWRRDFSVLDENARNSLWLRLIAEHGLKVRYPNRLAQRFEKFRQSKLAPDTRPEDDFARLVELTTAEKKRLNVLDFHDLLQMATWLLQENSLLAPPTWLIVDEFQDCNPAELAFLTALRGQGHQANFFAVGDPHQVIYAWRGSSPQLFDDIERQFHCARYDLPANYRSTSEILEGARAVLGWQAAQSILHSERGTGHKIRIRRHHNPHMESLYLLERIREFQQEGLRLRDIAVLFRMRRQAQAMHDWLSEQGIPCAQPSRLAVEERPAAVWLLHLLRLAMHGTGEVRDLLVHPQFGLLAGKHLNRRSVETFIQKQELQPLAGTLAFLRQKKALPVQIFAAQQLEKWLGLPQWLDQNPELGENPRTTDEFFQHLELAATLRPTSARHVQDVSDARLLLDRLTRWQEAHGQHGQAGMRAALDLLAMGGLGALGETADPAEDAVALMTLHAAKGLEFRQVFISGVNEGLVPLQSAWGDAEMDAEERRLLFVGLTRARDGVELSYHNQPAHPRAQPSPSPYLYQLPPHTVDWLDELVQAAPAKQVIAALETPQALESTWKIGQNVRHPRYGKGVVVGLTTQEVEVQFEKLASRAFDLALCPLVG